MECRAIVKVVLVGLLVVAFALPVGVSAQSRSGRGRGGLYGEWRIKLKLGDNEFESILAFSRNEEGYTGQWISSWGMNELKDVKFEDNKLSFTRVTNYGGQERTSKFTGAIEQGELSGLLVRDERETEIKSKRVPRPSRAVGSWEVTIKVGENEYTGTVTITADKEGVLSGTWKSSRGESKLSDVKYEDRKLTFKRVSERDGTRRERTFEGTVGYTSSLEGVFKSDSGESAVTGTRVGASAIGTWNLDIESERGARKQRLRVNADLSALYGSTLIKKVNLDGDKLSFKYALTFGDQEYETSFEGKIAESKLAGEVKTSRGTSKVTGAKRTYRRRGSSGR